MVEGRYYDPELGRFISPDPFLDGLNRYAYCSNNPVKYVDPTGFFAEDLFDSATVGLRSDYEDSNEDDGGSSGGGNDEQRRELSDLYNRLNNRMNNIQNSYDAMEVFGSGGFYEQYYDALSNYLNDRSKLNSNVKFNQNVTAGTISINGTLIPATGTITSLYGNRIDPITGEAGSFHEGIDIAGELGSDVIASSNGTVVYSDNFGDYGNLVVVKTANGHEGYAHLQSSDVKVNDTVILGDKVGSMGNTGRSTGTHLHFVRTEGTTHNWGMHGSSNYSTGFFQQYKGINFYHLNYAASVIPF